MDSAVAQGAEQKSSVFKYIELKLQWRGKLNAKDLMLPLAITRQTASKAIKSYKDLYPAALSYNSQQKYYQPTEQFRPSFISGHFHEYVSLFHHEVTDLQPLSIFPSCHRSPDPQIIIPVMDAIEKRQRLDISYASLSSPDFEERIIAPHTLAYDGVRWHIRAWCEKNMDYRDFVLTRIRDVFGCEGESTCAQDEDQAWNTWVELKIEPDPRLNKARKNIVAMDYGMALDSSGRLSRSYKVRGAMIIYWLQRLRLDRYRERAQAQQIVLCEESIREVEKWVT